MSGGPSLFPPPEDGRPRPMRVTAEVLRLRQNELRRQMAEVCSLATPDAEQGVNGFDVEHWFQQSKFAQMEVDDQDFPQLLDEVVADLKASLGEARRKLTFVSPRATPSTPTSSAATPPPTPPEQGRAAEIEDLDSVARRSQRLQSSTASQRQSLPTMSEIAEHSRCSLRSRSGLQEEENSSAEQDFVPEETDWAALWAWDTENKARSPPSEHSPRALEAGLDDEPRPMGGEETRASLAQTPAAPSSSAPTPAAPSSLAQTPAAPLSPALPTTPAFLSTAGSGRAETASGRATTASGRATTASSGRAITSASYLSNPASGLPSLPSARALTTARRITNAVHGSRWFSCAANIWPVLWLLLEILIHYVTILTTLPAIRVKLPEDGVLLKLLWPKEPVPNETVLALWFFWIFMAAHSFRRLHAFFRCYFRIRPILQDWRVAVCLAAREGTWLALDAADRTYAKKAMERNPSVAQSISEVNCCFRYWCLTCYLPCFHRAFLHSHFTALNVHHLEEKQAVVTMWELFDERGTCSALPQRGMKPVSLVFLLLNPFLGTTTYCWPEAVWLWKMMCWRAMTDIAYFFAFMEPRCFGAPSSLVTGRRLASPELLPEGRSSELFPEGAALDATASGSRQLSNQLQYVAQDCAWFIDNASNATTFWSPIGNATFTKNGCSVSVQLMLDTGASLGTFYQNLIVAFDSAVLQGVGSATDYRFEIDFRGPGGESFVWAGSVLLNGDLAINGTDQETVLTQATPASMGEACSNVTGSWMTADAGLALDSFSVLEQADCDLLLLNPDAHDFAQYPAVMLGPTFAFFADTMHIGHVWHDDTVLLYPSDFSSILTFYKASPAYCPICPVEEFGLNVFKSPSFTALTCGQVQSVSNQGAMSCWHGESLEQYEAVFNECCDITLCYWTGFLFVRFIFGVCTMFSLWGKIRKCKRIWQADLGGMVTNYWGRKDFWEKWVGSMEPADWSRPLDLWAEYGRLRRDDEISRWNQRRGLP